MQHSRHNMLLRSLETGLSAMGDLSRFRHIAYVLNVICLQGKGVATQI